MQQAHTLGLEYAKHKSSKGHSHKGIKTVAEWNSSGK